MNLEIQGNVDLTLDCRIELFLVFIQNDLTSAIKPLFALVLFSSLGVTNDVLSII